MGFSAVGSGYLLPCDFDPAAIDVLTVDTDGMIGDIHGTPDYRAHLVSVMTRRAVASSR